MTKRASTHSPLAMYFAELSKRMDKRSASITPFFLFEILAICELITVVGSLFAKPGTPDSVALDHVNKSLAIINEKLGEMDRKLDDILDTIRQLEARIQGIVDAAFLKHENGTAITATQNLMTYMQSAPVFDSRLVDVQTECTRLQEAINQIIRQTEGGMAGVAFVTPKIALWAQAWMMLQTKLPEAARIYVWNHEFHKQNMRMFADFFTTARMLKPGLESELKSLVNPSTVYSYKMARSSFSEEDIPFKGTYKKNEARRFLFGSTGFRGLHSTEQLSDGSWHWEPAALLAVLNPKDEVLYRTASAEWAKQGSRRRQIQQYFEVMTDIDAFEAKIRAFSMKPPDWP